jgi:hypothetical protein
MERFADPSGMDSLLGQINQYGPTTEDPLEAHVEGVRDAFQRGEIDEATYEEMMLSIGKASDEAGL